MAKANQAPFGQEFKEAATSAFMQGEFVRWDELGKKVQGTYQGKYSSIDPNGNDQLVYAFVDADGSYFRVGSRGKQFDSSMSEAQVGQRVGLLYAEDIASKDKGKSPFKLVKVYLGEVDPTKADWNQE